MHILVEMILDGTTYRLSQEGVRLTHWWDNRIISFDNITRAINAKTGGYCRLTFGTVQLAPDTFLVQWPPPVSGSLTLYYTATTEEAAIVLFTAAAHLRSVSLSSVSYDLYGDDFDTQLLEEATNHDGDTVPLPRAFGLVTHANPVRLPDQNAHYCYDLGHIQGTKHVNWHVFDDGVDICANVANVASNKFELTAAPVGEVTLTGTGEDATLVDIFGWACGASYLDLTLDHAHDRSTSPSLAHWATSQAPLVDFLDAIAASYTHLFYVLDGTLHLVDMLADNGVDATITEYEYCSAPYGYDAPLAKMTANWTVGEAGTWRNPTSGTAAAVCVKRTEMEHVVETAYPYGSSDSAAIYTDVVADIDTALDNQLAVLQAPRISLEMPMLGTWYAPGQKIQWTDASLAVATALWLRVRSIGYDVQNEKLIIEGEGGVS